MGVVEALGGNFIFLYGSHYQFLLFLNIEGTELSLTRFLSFIICLSPIYITNAIRVLAVIFPNRGPNALGWGKVTSDIWYLWDYLFTTHICPGQKWELVKIESNTHFWPEYSGQNWVIKLSLLTGQKWEEILMLIYFNIYYGWLINQCILMLYNELKNEWIYPIKTSIDLWVIWCIGYLVNQKSLQF